MNQIFFQDHLYISSINLLTILILIHIILLHNFSSSNPFINTNSFVIAFYPFIFKDLFTSFISIILSTSTFLYWEPDILGNSDNQVLANPLITPNNILPEWYYLLFYSCLRSFPNKAVGIILVVSLLVIVSENIKGRRIETRNKAFH